MKRARIQPVLNGLLIVIMLFGFLNPAENTVSAASDLTIEPITWNVIGLDSNNVNVGPNTFPVGARVCNSGDTTSGALTANFVWDSSNSYISLSDGNVPTLTHPGLAVDECTDFYYEVEVTRDPGAYDETRRYHIRVEEAGGTTLNTPMPRELYVEHLISQSRNGQEKLELSTDGVIFDEFAAGAVLTLMKGETYFLRLTAQTATNGYEQIESYLNLPNIYFRVLSVTTDYSAGTDIDMLYGDGCNWENDPNSPNYRSCLGVGKKGGKLITTYEVYIIDYRAGDPTPVSGMIYDFSGSSYHYNADYAGEARELYNLDPEQIPFTKTFVPDAIAPGEVSTATFRITNPSSLLITDVNFADDLPGDMAVAPTPALSFAGCGSPTSADVTPASQSISFADITLAPYAACVIKVNVTATAETTLTNVTEKIYFSIDGTEYAGVTATDELTIATNVRVCTPGSTLANWTVPVGAVSPPDTLGGIPSVTGPQVSSALATGVGGRDETFSIDTGAYTGNPVWEMAGKLGGTTRYTNKYFQFTVDTTLYENIMWNFALAELKNGPTSFDISYTPQGGTEIFLPSITGVTGILSTYSFTIGTGYLPAGNTVFRVYPYNAANTGKDAIGAMDAIQFTGTYCAPPPPSITKSFETDPILVNGVSQLTFNIANTSTNPVSGPLTGITFSDVLPAGFKVVAGTQSNTCGGTLTAAATTSSISLAGGSLASGASCSISVPVSGSVAGAFTNISNRISAIESGENKSASGFALDDITVIGPPSIAKDFIDEIILTNDTTSLTFVVSNPNPTVALTGVEFTDSLPTGLTVADSSSTKCGGTLTTTAPDTIELKGASLEPYGNCVFSVDITGAEDSGATPFTNTTGAVTSANGGTGNSATDTLYVREPMPKLSLLKQVSTSAAGPWYKYLVVTPETELYYKFTVENTGDVPLSNVTVTDPDVDVSSCPAVSLVTASLPDSVTTASCVVGSIIAVAGNHPNTASATGSYNSEPVISNNSTATYATPDLSLVKNVTEKYYTNAGQVLHYTYVVTNIGAILPGPVTINDDKTTVSCPSLTTVGDDDDDDDDWFETGESIECTATYTTTSTDTNVVNNATAFVDGYPSNEADAIVPKLPANFGHLPSSYLTMNMFNDGGARHITDKTAAGTYLGATVPIEADGINGPTFVAQRADDGVTFRGTWTSLIGFARIAYHCPIGATCYLNGWLDWNGNSAFDSADWIVKNQAVTGTGTTEYQFAIPSGTNVDNGRILHARFRVYSLFPGDAPLPNGQATDISGQPTVGEVEDYEITLLGGTPIHTPVTLSYFKAVRNGKDVTFNWSTATETGNMGFNLYVGDETARTLINPELIGSKVVDSLSRQDYTYTATVRGNTFFLEDVSVVDEAQVHGPFLLGKDYGDRAQNEIINWNLIQVEKNAKDTTRQRNLAPGLTIASGTKTASSALNFQVSKTGFYRVTYEMLKAAGYDLKGVQTAKIGLTSSGKAVPIYTFGKATFGPGNYIEFYGQALDTLYTDTNIYTLQTNASKPPRITVNTNKTTSRTKFATTYIETLKVHNQKGYSYSAPGDDPWYDLSLSVNRTPKYWNLPFTINGLANLTTATNLKLVVWGGTDWPQAPDHRLQVTVNGVALADEIYDGLVAKTLNLTLPAGVLVEGSNTLQITLPGNSGVNFETQRLDQYSVSYPRAFIAQDGRLTFTSVGAGFKVTNLPVNSVVVYRLDPSGTMTRLTPLVTKETNGTYTAAFVGSTTNSTYFVSTTTAMLAPEYEAVREKVDLKKQAEYLIISHPDFIAGLQPLVAARQAKYSVNVVDVTDIYTQYSYGVFDPDAIRQYIKYAADNLGTRYVLLVGGDTFDYRNYSKLNSVSFIPSLYTSTGSIINFAPVDPLYTDFNGDNIPDLPIGRFPVRTTAELNLVIQKTLQYDTKDYGQTAVFASDKFDQGYSFKQISESMAAKLPGDWSVDQISLENGDLNTARANLLAAMNRGTALVNYTGHSGPADWTFSGLFNQADVAGLTNAGRPFVVVQWGCWNNYYVYPNYNYLVQNFLLAGDKGAAAVLGATSLSEISSEELLGELLVPRLATPGMTIGQAIQDAKRQLGAEHPEMLDVLLGWTLMGDPTLVIEP